MTDDPERLLSRTSGAGALERELLSSLCAEAPPDGAREAAWHGLAGRIGALSVVAAAASPIASTAVPDAASVGGSATAKSAAQLAAFVPKALLSKVIAIVGLGALTSAGVWLAARGEAVKSSEYHAEPARTSRAPAPVLAPPLPSPTVAELAPSACVGAACSPAEPAPALSVRRAPTDAERTSLLNRESALLIQARAELRAGRVSGARATLTELETRFPHGMLGQEREVLRIELLAAQGDQEGAKRRAQAFVRAHPNSPHSGKLARFSTAP
jgi:hypothetical protein